jgi:hypothetical protein
MGNNTTLFKYKVFPPGAAQSRHAQPPVCGYPVGPGPSVVGRPPCLIAAQSQPMRDPLPPERNRRLPKTRLHRFDPPLSDLQDRKPLYSSDLYHAHYPDCGQVHVIHMLISAKTRPRQDSLLREEIAALQETVSINLPNDRKACSFKPMLLPPNPPNPQILTTPNLSYVTTRPQAIPGLESQNIQ